MQCCALAVGFVFLTACDDTRQVQSWTAEKATTGEMQKVVTFVMTPSASTRRIAEQVMAQELRERGIAAAAGFEVLEDGDLRNVVAARQKLSAAGFDGALILRPLDKETEVNYTGGAFPPYYSTFWGYYGWGWPYVYDPAYVHTTRVRTMEAMAYSLDQDRLLWTGLLENRNGSDLQDIVEEVAEEVAERMQNRELLASASR